MPEYCIRPTREQLYQCAVGVFDPMAWEDTLDLLQALLKPVELKQSDIRRVCHLMETPECLRLLALEKVAEEIEWVYDDRTDTFYCPVCQNSKQNGHHHDCALAVALEAK